MNQTNNSFRSVKSSKIQIDCETSKSLIKFNKNEEDGDINFNNNEPSKTFVNLMRNQIILEYKDLNDFLEKIKAENLLETLLSKGIDSVDKLRSHNKDSLCALGVPLGFVLKIVKEIEERKKIVENVNYNEINENDANVGNENETSFAKCVEEFRKQIQEDKLKEKENEKVNENENFNKKLANDDFFNFDNILQFDEKNLTTNEKIFLPLHQEKKCCFSCFKLFIGGMEINGKYFCDEECFQRSKEIFYVNFYLKRQIVKNARKA